ncbi:MAG: DUF4097 family beta strand repeat protein [Brevinematales bacterium]|nr:DUF4097 family beta strand repeat protein [Brevinematales bacterium]
MKNAIIKLSLFAALAVVFTACDFWAPGIRIYEVKNYQFSTNNNQTFSLSIESGSITFLNSDDPYIKVVMTNFVDAGGYTYGKQLLEDNDLFSISSNNQSIIITQNKTITVDNWNVYGVGTEILVYVPIGVTFLTQKINSETAAVFYTLINTAPYIEINTTTGAVELSYLDAGTVKINTTTGAVNFFSIDCNSLSIITVTGSIDEMGDAINSPSVYLEVTTGNINVHAVNVNSLTAKTTTGNITVDFVSFLMSGSHASLTGTTGNIDAIFSSGATSALKVDAAVITGAVHSDITFASLIKDTHNIGAEYIAQNGGGTNPVTMRMTTGAINIDNE